MTNRRKWHIYEVSGDVAKHVREGSVRLGRTLRAAKRYKRTTNARVVVARAIESSAGTIMDRTQLMWSATVEHPELIQQRRNRAELAQRAAAAQAEKLNRKQLRKMGLEEPSDAS